MKYFVRTPGSPAVIGPYSVGEIEARLKAGELSADALATEDTGDSPANATGWLCVHQLPGVGGNPPMPSLDTQLATPPDSNQKFSAAVAPGEPVCRMCSARVLPGETLCRKCAERAASAEKASVAPHPLRMLLLHVPGGMLIHFISFFFVCGGGVLNKNVGPVIIVALLHNIAWIAYAIRLIRKPADKGVGFGILIGVCQTGFLTGTCALARL